MQIAIIENGNVTQVGDYRDLFPNTSFTANGPDSEWLAEHNAKKVNLYKEHDRLTQKLVSVAPYVDGDFVSLVEVADLSAEEIESVKQSAMTQVRATRNTLLAQSDWTQIADCNIPKKADWAKYRQALRDLPSKVEDARTFTDWPKDPDWKPIDRSEE